MGIGTFSSAHDVPVAHFNLLEKDDRLMMEMEFDQGALASAILDKKDRSSLTNRQIKEYLSNHIQLTINKRIITIRIDRIKKKGHHVFVQATIAKPRLIIEQVLFKNTCLINVVPDHTNVLMTDINCITRGFQLNKERQEVSFSY